MGFNWSKLPKKEYNDFILFTEGDYKKKLLELHNKYKLSNFDYQSCCDLGKLIKRCRSAIRRGVVYKVE